MASRIQRGGAIRLRQLFSKLFAEIFDLSESKEILCRCGPTRGLFLTNTVVPVLNTFFYDLNDKRW